MAHLVRSIAVDRDWWTSPEDGLLAGNCYFYLWYVEIS
jgi:hypothetical protein